MKQLYPGYTSRGKQVVPKGFPALFVVILLSNSILLGQPVITSFAPDKAPVGTTVSISGTGFSTIPTDNIVYFGAVRAQVLAATGTQLDVTVPAGATYAPVTVTYNGLTAYSSQQFIVTFSLDGADLSNTFTHQATYPAGTRPSGLCLADFDGDGKPDIAAANYLTFNVSILKNTSAGSAMSFAAPQTYITLSSAMAAAAGDFDGDGKPDLAVACGDGNGIAVYKNISSGGAISFGPRISYTAGNSPSDIAIADIDGDGKPDIIVTNFDANTFSLFRNTSTAGSISFAARIDIATGSSPRKICVGDLDGDGKPDITVVNRLSSSFSLFRNTSVPGNPSFASRADYTTPTAPNSIVMGDFDNDGKLDLAAACNSDVNVIAVYRNTSSSGAISIGSRQDFENGPFPVNLAAGDLSGDGKPDLAVVMYDGSVVLVGNTSTTGAISFAPGIIYNSNNTTNTFVALGDVDGNGKTDMVISASVNNIVTVVQNLADGPLLNAFAPQLAGPGATVILKGKNFTGVSAVYFGGTPAASFTFIDDSTVSATVGTGASGNVTLETPHGSTGLAGFSFTSQLTIQSIYPSSGSAGSTLIITGANFDATAANDIVYFGQAKATILSSSSTALTVTVPAGATYAPVSVTTGGKAVLSPTFFSLRFPGAAAAFTSHSFATKKDFPAGQNPYKVAAADLDGDGKPDLVVSNAGESTVSVFINTSTTGVVSFAAKADYVSGNSPDPVSLADLNGDGRPDIIVANISSGTLSVFANASTGGILTLGTRQDFTTGSRPVALSVGDLDGDGKPDIAVANQGSSTISIFQNTSSGSIISFAPRTDITVPNAPDGVYVIDLTADGKPDMAVTSFDAYPVSVYRNISINNTISFAANVDYWSNTSPGDMTGGDMDGDGKIDLLVANLNANTFSAFRNTTNAGSLSLSAKEEFTLGAPATLSTGDLDGDGKIDLAATDFAENAAVLFKNRSNGISSYFAFVSTGYGCGASPSGLVQADLDGDGKPDLVVTNYNANSLSILRNTVGEALVTPSGVSPAGDIAVNRQTVDSTIQVYNGAPYVQRHYDIEPATNAANATATVILYFTQADFDNFNAWPGHGPDLPISPGDISGKANLRIYQYHGFSATGLPGSYSGSAVVIDPDDANITWDGDAALWQVSFAVTGFSGFFAGTNAAALPITLLSFTGKPKGKLAQLDWVSSEELSAAYFEVQRGVDGIHFNPIGIVHAAGNSTTNKAYQYIDSLPAGPVCYYRLRMVDQDNKYTFSQVIVLSWNNAGGKYGLYPNPAHSYVMMEHPVQNHAVTIQLMDMSGRLLKTIEAEKNTGQTRIELNGLMPGAYMILFGTDKQGLKLPLLVR